MVIGVTHFNGEVFPHFGRSPEIALYLVDDNKEIVKKSIVTVDNGGHENIGMILMDTDVDVFLCGGIGGGAINMLYSIGVQVYPGCYGNTDELVKQFLSGNIIQVDGPTCNCHEHEEEHSCECDSHDNHHCGCH